MFGSRNLAAYLTRSLTKKRYVHNATSKSPIKKSGLLMDANGIVYKRVQSKLNALSYYLLHSNTTMERYNPEQYQTYALEREAAKIEDLRVQATKGQVPKLDYYKELLKVTGVNPHDMDGAMRQLVKAESNIAPTKDFVISLTQLRFKHRTQTALITDTVSPTLDKLSWMRAVGIDSLFVELKTSKPDAKMYLHAVKALGLAPSDCVFVGHKKSELDGAKALGITTIAMFPDANLLANDGALLREYDYHVSGWKHLVSLPIWQDFLPPNRDPNNTNDEIKFHQDTRL